MKLLSPVITRNGEPFFGARAAGVIFITVITTYFLSEQISLFLFRYVFGKNAVISNTNVFVANDILASISSTLLSLLIIIMQLRPYVINCRSRGAIKEWLCLGRLPNISTMLLFFLVGVGIVLIFEIVLIRIFPPPDGITKHPLNVLGKASLYFQISYLLLAITIVPVVEEIIFRGVLFKGFKSSFGTVISAALVTVMFVSLHRDIISTGYWLTHFALYAVSIILIVTRILTRNLYSTILIHAGFNFAVFAF